jgi:hypothetical protein
MPVEQNQPTEQASAVVLVEQREAGARELSNQCLRRHDSGVGQWNWSPVTLAVAKQVKHTFEANTSS